MGIQDVGDQHLQTGVSNPRAAVRGALRVRRTRKRLQFMCQRDAPTEPALPQAYGQRDRRDSAPVGSHSAELGVRGGEGLQLLHDVASPRRQAPKQEDEMDAILHRGTGVWEGHHSEWFDGEDVRWIGTPCYEFRLGDGEAQQRCDVQVPGVHR